MSDAATESGWIIEIVKWVGIGSIVQFANIIANRRKVAADAQKSEDEGSAALETIVSDRIKSLLEHYESRVKDLTDEVHNLRAEVTELRKALDRRPNIFGA